MRSDDVESARQLLLEYRLEQARAHGIIPRPELPEIVGHLCPARSGWYFRGSREACPHCKIAAPLDAGPGKA